MQWVTVRHVAATVFPHGTDSMNEIIELFVELANAGGRVIWGHDSMSVTYKEGDVEVYILVTEKKAAVVVTSPEMKATLIIDDGAFYINVTDSDGDTVVFLRESGIVGVRKEATDEAVSGDLARLIADFLYS